MCVRKISMARKDSTQPRRTNDATVSRGRIVVDTLEQYPETLSPKDTERKHRLSAEERPSKIRLLMSLHMNQVATKTHKRIDSNHLRVKRVVNYTFALPRWNSD